MSKNTVGAKGLGELQVLLAPEPEPEVVDAIIAHLASLPELGVLEQVAELKSEAMVLEKEERELLSQAGTVGVELPELKNRIGSLRGRLAQFSASVKNAVLNSDTLNHLRAQILGSQKLSDYLEEYTTARLQESPSYTKLMEELRGCVAKATQIEKESHAAVSRAQELHQHRQELEKEARSLLESVALA